MYLWKDQFSAQQLATSGATLAGQLKLYKKAGSSKHWKTPDSYVQWLESHCQGHQQDRIADQLLALCHSSITLSSVAAAILWEIEMRRLLPDRCLQMKCLSHSFRSPRKLLYDTPRRWLRRILSTFQYVQPEWPLYVRRKCCGRELSG